LLLGLSFGSAWAAPCGDAPLAACRGGEAAACAPDGLRAQYEDEKRAAREAYAGYLEALHDSQSDPNRLKGLLERVLKPAECWTELAVRLQEDSHCDSSENICPPNGMGGSTIPGTDQTQGGTFSGGSYEARPVGAGGLELHRYFSCNGQTGSGFPLGAFMTETDYDLQAPGVSERIQSELALDPAWGNRHDCGIRFVVPEGTLVFAGKTAPVPLKGGGVLAGGGSQVFVVGPQADWCAPGRECSCLKAVLRDPGKCRHVDWTQCSCLDSAPPRPLE
jgi:hypothetical protein